MLEGTMAIAITRLDHSADDFRSAAARERNGSVARRILALALILDGKSRTEAAESCGMDRQTLRDWVHRYNSDGLAGLRDRAHTGRPGRLTAAQKAELREVVETGPELERDGVVRWRCVDLKGVLKARFNVDLAERSVGRILNELGFRRLSPRPHHPNKDTQAQETYKKTSQHS
jgi:transposase